MSFDGIELVNASRQTFGREKLAGKRRIGLYFSASWCPPCKGFTPTLLTFYDDLARAGKLDGFEIIFISSDKDEAQFWDYMNDPTGKGGSPMPWLALPYNSPKKPELGKRFEVKGIPCLVIVDENGQEITRDGREHVTLKGPKILNTWNQLSPKGGAGGGGGGGAPGSGGGGEGEPREPGFVHGKSKHKGHVAPFIPASKHAPPIRRVHESEETKKREEYIYEDEDAGAFKWKNPMVGDDVVPVPRTNRGFDESREGTVTPVHAACRDGDIQMLKFISKRKVQLNVKDQYGRTPLHYAAMHGGGNRPAEFCKELAGTEWTEMGREVDNKGNTALHYACRYGHAKIASFLLQSNNGSMMKEMRNKKGERPYDLLLLHGKTEIFKGQDSQTIVPADIAAKLAVTELTQPQRGRKMGSVPSSMKHEKRCNQALYAAVMSENAEEVKLLLETTPARPDATKKGVTIMDEALRIGNMTIIRLLDNKLNPELPINIDNFGYELEE